MPPSRSSKMGSYVYAREALAARAQVKLMISIEMVGYFADAPGSQRYPVPGLDWLYPGRGNFIGIVGRAFDRQLVSRVRSLMYVGERLPVHSINAPAIVPGIDRSDHRNFWEAGLPAVMVTDTADYRNPNYHRSTDTPDTLDYGRMAAVADGLYRVAVAY